MASSNNNNDSDEMTTDTYHGLREKYLQLTSEMQEKAESAGSGGIDITTVKESICAANDAFMQVKRPREAVLDGKYMKLITQVAKTNIEASQASLLKFNPLEFADKLIEFMVPSGTKESLRSKEPWIRLGKELSTCHPGRAFGLEPMVPALEAITPAPTERKRATRTSDVQIVAKKITQSEQQSSEEAQTEEVNRVFKVLRRRFKENGNQPLCFYTFVTNPESFPHTIENMFHIAFLLRDGYAQITENENKLPVIEPIAAGSSDRNGPTNQCILSLTMAEWEEVIEVFNIKESLIPPPVRENKRAITD